MVSLAMSANERLLEWSPRDINGENGDLFYLTPTPGIKRRAAPVGRFKS